MNSVSSVQRGFNLVLTRKSMTLFLDKQSRSFFSVTIMMEKTLSLNSIKAWNFYWCWSFFDRHHKKIQIVQTTCTSSKIVRSAVTNVCMPLVLCWASSRVSFADGLNIIWRFSSVNLFPLSNDIIVDLPTPCFPIMPTTKKSVWSCKNFKRNSQTW